MLVLLILSIMIAVSILYLMISNELFTKLLIMNYITSLVVVLIAAMSLLPYYSSYLDIAFIYLLLSFIASLAFLQYFDKSRRKSGKENE